MSDEKKNEPDFVVRLIRENTRRYFLTRFGEFKWDRQNCPISVVYTRESLRAILAPPPEGTIKYQDFNSSIGLQDLKIPYSFVKYRRVGTSAIRSLANWKFAARIRHIDAKSTT